MAKGFDELVDYLLDEVALRFADGASLDDFKNAVLGFYAESTQKPIDGSSISKADRQLQEKAWAWLLLHSDIWVGRKFDDDSSPEILVSEDQDASVLSLIEAESLNIASPDGSSIRIWTSHERVWQTVAGHGVDFKRIPGEQFRLLCLIASAGPKGIPQPELVKLSKQDKKSVPGRTDDLHKNGYLRKTKVLVQKHNTSLLVHRRFLDPEDADVLTRPVFSNGSLHFENLLNLLKDKLKNGTSIKMEDLEELLGCLTKSWEKKALWRALERLDIIGVIQRFRNSEWKEGMRGMRNFKTRYLRLLREPTEDDFKRYTNLTVKDREAFRRRLEAQDDDARGEHEEFLDEDDYAPETTVGAFQLTDGAVASHNLPTQNQKLNWDPDLPWTNTLFNVINKAGVAGLSTMGTRAATYGHAFERPMEQMLSRLTDAWQNAQPAYLKYFSIVRDTDTHGRSTNYLYRTYDAFQEAVDRTDTVWENANGGKPYKKVNAQLDEFGFDKIDSKLLLNEGRATLAQSLVHARPELEITVRTDPVLKRQPDGTLRVAWNHNLGGKKKAGPKSKSAPIVIYSSSDENIPNPIAANTNGPDVDQHPEAPVRQHARDYQAEVRKRKRDEREAAKRDNAERTKAEEKAYREAIEQEKFLPLPIIRGKQIDTIWKSGSGRRKFILIDDTVPAGEEDVLPLSTGKRLPVIVLESRVRAHLNSPGQFVNHAGLETTVLLQDLVAPSHPSIPSMPSISLLPTLPTLPALPSPEQRQLVIIKSPRLKELEWFGKSTSESVSTLQPTSQDTGKISINVLTAKRKAGRPKSRPYLNIAPTSTDNEVPLTRRGSVGFGSFRVPSADQTDRLIIGVRSDRLPSVLPVSKETTPRAEESSTPARRTRPASLTPSTKRPLVAPLRATPSKKRQKVTGPRRFVINDDSDSEAEVQAPAQRKPPAETEHDAALEDGFEDEEPKEIRGDEQSQSLNTPRRKDWSQRESTYIRPSALTSRRRKKGTLVGRGTAQYKRTLIVEQIMDKCGGIYPGDSEMVPAFQRIQRLENSESISDRDTIMKAVKSLVDAKKLTRISFYFDYKGKLTTKYILTKPEIPRDYLGIEEMKNKIKEFYPKNYIPHEADDGESNKGKQAKNIDRFQYQPGRSIVQPEGTEWVIDVHAKQAEMERQRLAAEEEKRKEESKRLKAQAARNKKRLAEQGKKQRQTRGTPRRTTLPKPNDLDFVPDENENEDPDQILPSIETTDLAPAGPALTRGRTRYREIRPQLTAEGKLDALGSGFWVPIADPYGTKFSLNYQRSTSVYTNDGEERRELRTSSDAEDNAIFSTLTQLDLSTRPKPRRFASSQEPQRGPYNQLISDIYHESFVPPAPAPARKGANRRLAVSKSTLVHGMLVFKPPQGPQTYDPFYEVQDVTSLVAPSQRFHPNSGTFSTDFFVRTNVRTREWREPSEITFEHHTATDPNDVQVYKQTDDYDNFYHPDKKPRKSGPGLLSKKSQRMELGSDDESDEELDASMFEKQELQIMMEQYPGLLHEEPQDGFVNSTFGHDQRIAKEMYQYGIKPMEHIVLHGVSLDEMPRDIQFGDRGRRPNIPKPLTELDEDLAYALPPVPAPRAPPTRRNRGGRIRLVDYELPAFENPATVTSRTPIKQSGNCFISPTEARRLFFACIATRCLSGELDGTIRWQTIFEIFANHPNLDVPTFKARWLRMHNNHRDVIERVQREFQDAFVLAYEKGELPTLDILSGMKLHYKDSAKWIRLVDWAVKTIPVFPDDIGLPATRDLLDEVFEFKTTLPDIQDLREKMEHAQATNSRREEIAHAMNFTLPLRSARKVSQMVSDEITDFEVAKSWARANCAALEENYNKAAAHEKLKKLDQSVLKMAVKQLHNDKVIAHSFKLRNKLARNYHLSDQYNQIFNKRSLEGQHFTEALAFKSRLDAAIASSDPRIIIDFVMADGAVMALTEMLAAGRVRIKPLLPVVNSEIGAPWPRLTVWGFAEGHYKLRNMDKSKFIWDIEITPTKNYVAGLPVEDKIKSCPPPTGDNKIPLWYDIHGNLLPRFWEALVRCVVQHIAIKAGSSIETLTAPYKGCIWDWEIKMLVEWLIEIGVAEWKGMGAVAAKEWWWTVVPKIGDAGNVLVDPEIEGLAVNRANGVNEASVSAPVPAMPMPKKRRGPRGGKAKYVGRSESRRTNV